MFTNKEDFGIVGRFLVRWKFDFWVMKLGKCLILVGFDAIGFAAFPGLLVSFCHPPYTKNNGISTFFRRIVNRTNVR